MNLLKPNFWKKNSLIVFLLLPFTLITRLIIFFKSINSSYKPNISTICVGNIYIGGTGKTQLVLKLDEILKRKYKTFVIKKYYRNQIDEQKLLAKNTNLILPIKRIDGIKKIENSIKNLAIFDDGLQDKSIKYSTSIVCFSSISGVGNGKILPAGPLREDLSKLKNYNMVFINGKKNTDLIRKIKKYNHKIKIFSGKYYLKNKKEFNSKSKYLAFCGIGTPENFFYLLQENGIKLAKKIIFPDHFNYKNSDISKIKELASKNNLKIVTTEKDYMKVKKYKKFKTKFTNVDLNINNIYNFKNFLIKNL